MTDEKQAASNKRLAVLKIFVKDLSFESPQAPNVFRRSDLKPQTTLNLRSSHSVIEGDAHEIVLTLTIDAKDGDKTIFLVELQQAGLFEIAGYKDEELGAIIGSFCPNMLFPYARETIASMVQKGGFPEFVLQPINFDALYLQAQAQRAAQAAPATAAPAETH